MCTQLIHEPQRSESAFSIFSLLVNMDFVETTMNLKHGPRNSPCLGGHWYLFSVVVIIIVDDDDDDKVLS